jgi:hypothetical protein
MTFQLIYVILPVAVPIIFTLVISNFTYNAFLSRHRIRLLEKSGKRNRETIMDLMRSLEREVEETVVDYVETGEAESTPESSRSITPLPTHASTSQREDADVLHSGPTSSSPTRNTSQPVLLPAQERMIANLNSIPHLKKQFVFYEGLTNTHATIVCRDIKRFSFHKKGEGVLRHLADNMVV